MVKITTELVLCKRNVIRNIPNNKKVNWNILKMFVNNPHDIKRNLGWFSCSLRPYDMTMRQDIWRSVTRASESQSMWSRFKFVVHQL